MAGKPLSFIESELGSNRVIRAMPNLAARHKASANGFCLAKGASSKDKSLAERLFSSFGIFVELKEEQLDAFTALGGSGPGYFFYFAKALSNAGVAAGLSEKEAREVARQVLIGAAKIAENSEESFEALVSQVATPGGTTEAALAEFENSKLGEIARRAVEKAKLRSKELAKK
jgi:pyrroline-5-carboxylate reductase